MEKIDLLKISTKAPEELSKKKIVLETEQLLKKIAVLQENLFAEGKQSLLVVLQALDAGGKDGTVRNVFGLLNPQGVTVKSFKKPTEEELSHDFLWRIHQHTPAKGMVQIFNRSHYEDVLVTRVLGHIDSTTAYKRYNYINTFEQILEDNGTKILKFYLHISEEEQSERFLERLNDPTKYWKFRQEDLETAKYWPKYREYFSEIFEKCSPERPWHIIPSDQKWYRNYLVAKILHDTLEEMDFQYPQLEVSVEEIEIARDKLSAKLKAWKK